MKQIINLWTKAGIHTNLDEEERRRVFLTNFFSLFLMISMLIVGLNDFLFAKNYLAGYRRIGVISILCLVPILNSYQYYKSAKALYLFFPPVLLIGVPIIIGDFFPGQIIWFQYLAAISCALPLILFDIRKDKPLLISFFLFYFLITIFIDKVLITLNPQPKIIADLVWNFTEFKLPPIFVALFSAFIMLWYNRVNARYQNQLKNTNEELQEAQEELIAKNEEYEAINRNLEALVQERSNLVETKNQQIINYANINAHKVRGPLARIMGLINISDYSQDPEELKSWFEKLSPPAKELNDIINEINRTLEQGELKNKEKE